MPRVGIDLQAERARRCCAAATACSTASSASVAATSSRAASAQNTNTDPVARQRADVHRHAVEPVPERHPGAGRQRAGHRDVPRPGHHLLRSEPEVAAHAALADRRPARAAGPVDGRGELRRQLRLAAADVAQHQRDAEPVPEHEPDAGSNDDQLPRRQRARIPSSACCRRPPSPALQGQNIARERLLRPYPQFDAVNTTTNEGWSWYNALQLNLQRRFAGGYTVASSYTYSHFTEAYEFLNAGDAEPWKGISSSRLAAPADRQRHLGAAVRPRPPLRRPTRNGVVERADRRLAVLGHLQLPERLPDRLRQHHLHRRPRRHRRCRRASGRWRAGSTSTPASTARQREQLASNVRTFPLRLENVRYRQRQQLRPVAHQEHADCGASTLELRFDSLNAFNHPLFPRPASPTRRRPRFGVDQRVDAGTTTRAAPRSR